MSSTRSWSSPRASHMSGSGAREGDPLACSQAGEEPEGSEEMKRSIRKRHETFREPTAEGEGFNPPSNRQGGMGVDRNLGAHRALDVTVRTAHPGKAWGRGLQHR